MSRYRFKAFDPKPFEPGSVVEWKHFRPSTEGTPYHLVAPGFLRRGVVWSGAPTAEGRRHVWVIPDEPLPDDLYRAVCVRVPSASETVGALSSDERETTTGHAMLHAASAARATQQARTPTD